MGRFSTPPPIPLLLLPLFLLFAQGCGHSPIAVPVLDPQPESMELRVHWPADQNQWFILLVPKSLGTRTETLMNFPLQPIHWSAPESDGSIRGSYHEEGRFAFEAKVTPSPGVVSMLVDVTNLSGEVMEGAWLFTFLAPHGAPAFHDPKGERTYLSVEGRATPLAEIPWPESPRPELAAFPAMTLPQSLPDQVRGLNVEASTRPGEGWMIATNEDATASIAHVSPNPIFLFRNREISSLHVAPGLGDIAPGATARVEMRALFGVEPLPIAIESARRHLRALEAKVSR